MEHSVVFCDVQVGSIGSGRLAYSDGLTWLMKFDDLAYFSRFGAQREVPLPIVFHDQAPANVGRQFRALVVIPFEPLAPPVFRRDLLWDGDPRSPGESPLMTSSTRFFLYLVVALATMTVAF